MITINDDYLSLLSDEQVHYSGTFLEDVFLHHKKGLSIDVDPQVETVRVLLLSVPTDDMKQRVFEALDLPTQLRLAKQLNGAQLFDVFCFTQDMTALKRLFQELSDSRKQTLLRELYKVDKTKYAALKELIAHKVSMIGGHIIPQSKAVQEKLKKDVQLCLAIIKHPQKTPQHIKLLNKHVDSKYELEELEQLTALVIRQFSTLKIAIKSQQHFMVYLKFYHFIMPYLMLFPSLKAHLTQTIDTLIMALKDMPTGRWVVKLMAQLPKEMIRETLQQLKRFERIAQFEKRNVYCTLLKDIKDNLNAPEAAVVRQLFKE